MNAPLESSKYPRYFKEGKKLIAFTDKDKMYKIEPIGSNKNPGVTIDHYITRKMVLKHWSRWSNEIPKEQFEASLKKLFFGYIDKIVNEIPCTKQHK